MLPDSSFFTLKPLSDGIYAAIVKEGRGAWGNAGIIDLGDSTLIIDTFSTPAAARDLRKAAESLVKSQEQRKIIWADFILFQFPLWWTDAPAILKGWFDRVFAYQFAYGPGRYEEGLLKGKKPIINRSKNEGQFTC